MASLENAPSVDKVAIVGAGLLGIRIAGELALRGCTVHVYDYNPLTVQTVHTTISQQLDDLKQQGLLDWEHKMQGAVIADSILSSAVAEADIVIEAVKEDVNIKNKLFTDIASVCSEETVLCTSSLTLSLEDIFTDVPHKERVMGLRFLYPVYLIDCCEMTFMNTTSREVISKAHCFLRSMGKSAHCRVPGFPRKLSHEEALHIQLIIVQRKQYYMHNYVLH